MSTRNTVRRLAGFELEELHGHRFAELNALAASVMNRLGVPREQQGIIESGTAARTITGEPFTFEHEPPQGGRNTRPGRQPLLERTGNLRVERAGVCVDAGVLDELFLPFESWRTAELVHRMEAVIAHELAESRSPGTTGAWRHADAILQSQKNHRLSPEARAIIADQLRAATSGADSAIKNTSCAQRIHAMLAAVTARRATDDTAPT